MRRRVLAVSPSATTTGWASTRLGADETSRTTTAGVIAMADDDRAIREKLDEEFLMACPRGHTSLRPAETTPTVYCKTCGRAYEFDDLHDRRHEALPEQGADDGSAHR